MTNNKLDQSDQWLRTEVENKREQLVNEFSQGKPKLKKINDHLGIWVQINTGDNHDLLSDTVEDMARHLNTRGYNVRAVYNRTADPETGEPHYEGHIYALPVEVGQPPFPEHKMPSLGDSKELELLAE